MSTLDNPSVAKTWTDDQDAILTRMAREGYSASQIGAVVGKSRSAVIGRASRASVKLGVNGHQRTAARDMTISSTRTRGGNRGGKVSMTRLRALPVEPIIAPVEATEPVGPELRLPLMDLEPHHCRAIVEGCGEHALFCGREKRIGSSYCTHHHGRYLTRAN